MHPISTFSLPAIPVQPIHDSTLASAGVSLSVLRLDQSHPVITGNKWFKLKYNLQQARHDGVDTLLSFGGQWSNHLHALAAAGKAFGFRTIGIVRGELTGPLNACLRDAQAAGMELLGISRSDYRRKSDPAFIASLQARFGCFHLIPEGGANREGMLGCAEIATLYPQEDFDLVCLACGSGTLLAGLATASTVPLLGFQVLRGTGYLEKEVRGYFERFGLSPRCAWSIDGNYHFGGYARTSSELMRFLTDFERNHGLPLEPVYSGKLLYGIFQGANKRDIFPRNSRILAIHGGGMQGRRGYEENLIHIS